MLLLQLAVCVMALAGCKPAAPTPTVVQTTVKEAARAGGPIHVVRGRPIAWCAAPRPNDPLMLDALELGTLDENEGSALDDLRALHRIPLVAAHQIVMVTDEAVCEQLARAYEGATSIYRHTEKGLSVEPVHVVSLGHLYLVESAGNRKDGYEVKFFNRSWKHLRGGFGVEF